MCTLQLKGDASETNHERTTRNPRSRFWKVIIFSARLSLCSCTVQLYLVTYVSLVYSALTVCARILLACIIA